MYNGWSFVGWMFNKLASEDMLDLNSFLSDMDPNQVLTSSEANEQAYFDAMANHNVKNNPGDPKTPLGMDVR